jgi:hypothetical protein
VLFGCGHLQRLLRQNCIRAATGRQTMPDALGVIA